jgi:hypothetical protein
MRVIELIKICTLYYDHFLHFKFEFLKVYKEKIILKP